jgi:hypothetical protein
MWLSYNNNNSLTTASTEEVKTNLSASPDIKLAIFTKDKDGSLADLSGPANREHCEISPPSSPYIDLINHLVNTRDPKLTSEPRLTLHSLITDLDRLKLLSPLYTLKSFSPQTFMASDYLLSILPIIEHSHSLSLSSPAQ